MDNEIKNNSWDDITSRHQVAIVGPFSSDDGTRNNKDQSVENVPKFVWKAVKEKDWEWEQELEQQQQLQQQQQQQQEHQQDEARTKKTKQKNVPDHFPKLMQKMFRLLRKC